MLLSSAPFRPAPVPDSLRHAPPRPPLAASLLLSALPAVEPWAGALPAGAVAQADAIFALPPGLAAC